MALVISTNPLRVQCPFDDCKYIWEPRVSDPKCCPRCTRYLVKRQKLTEVKCLGPPKPGESFYLCEDCRQPAVVCLGGKNLCKACGQASLGKIEEVFSENSRTKRSDVGDSTVTTKAQKSIGNEETVEEYEARLAEEARSRKRGGLSRKESSSS